MWLLATFDESEGSNGNGKGIPYSHIVEVSIYDQKVAPVDGVERPFRVSPIFPLVKEAALPDVKNCRVIFFNFKNAYRSLGRIEKLAEGGLKEKIFISIGLNSVILIFSSDIDLKEFKKIIGQEPDGYEEWKIVSGKLENVDLRLPKSPPSSEITFVDYSSLPTTERALVDEFKLTIKLMLLKVPTHMPFELPKIQRLVEEVNELVTELVAVYDETYPVPESLGAYSRSELSEKANNLPIKYQNIDRIIQINSALSYVSTQAFSGAIPILERRSLIRRDSLLGVGSAILALNNISKFIEDSFSIFAFDEVIAHQFPHHAALPGLDNLPQYDSKDWKNLAFDTIKDAKSKPQSYLKLPYFSGRLGFRETEFTIAAAIQSISSGAGIEWSLMTLTHEMLHGHVRTLIDAVFYGDPKKKENIKRKTFYDRFKAIYQKKAKDVRLIDSIRAIIFTYCCMTEELGSLTRQVEYRSSRYPVKLLPEDELWSTFAEENRNIHEIFVHVLDLNYFYGSRLTLYIPLIWGSWGMVPHVNTDLRQYILRSLLTIASRNKLELYKRFYDSVGLLKEILERHVNGRLNFPAVKEVLKILENKQLMAKMYLPAFKASLIVVDLVTDIFISSSVRGKLFQDRLVNFVDEDDEEDGIERVFRYELPDGFNDEVIQSPVGYLLDKMAKLLHSDSELDDIEKETAMLFLALNSKE